MCIECFCKWPAHLGDINDLPPLSEVLIRPSFTPEACSDSLIFSVRISVVSFSMLCKATLLAVALGLVASATPVTRDTGIRIPLQKHGSLTKADGTFDHDAAIRQIVKTQKYTSPNHMYAAN